MFAATAAVLLASGTFLVVVLVLVLGKAVLVLGGGRGRRLVFSSTLSHARPTAPFKFPHAQAQASIIGGFQSKVSYISFLPGILE